MSYFKRTIVAVLAVAVASFAQEPKAETKPAAPEREPGLYATITTTQGAIVCKLFEKEAPVTVQNFTGLARGTKEWTDPKTGQKVKRPLYNGTTFHRVIPGFMIQGGDPLGTGMGGPGYDFKDEFSPSLKFDQVGRLAMANSGPNTNGSQFFITVAPTPHLNNHHTIFGQVVEGQDVVDKIVNVPKDSNDKPRTAVVIKSIRIQRYPLAAPTAKTEGTPAVKKEGGPTKKPAPPKSQ
jgi:peptidyl-prolyl cis-trans isomerase A (cyclophilin A)